jgi:hypothetical protein
MSDYRPSTTLLICLVVVGILLPVVYILSIGPVYWLVAQGYLSIGAMTAYSPLEWLALNCPPFHDAIDWYLSFFQ